jgi:hypothetical protein
MTHQIYSQQQLQLKSIARLKQIYSEIACTAEVNDKRCKDSWITAFVEDVGAAIANYQASKIQKVAPAAPDNQALAQAELDSYIADQAQAIAPEPLTIVEISFYHHEYYADDKLVASISYDDNHLTQRWVVMVNEKEVFRANTLMRCDRFICTHYRGHLGTWVRTFYPQLGDRQETRLVNGVQQPIYVYACHEPTVAAGLTKAIEEFFAHPSPGTALRQAGAFASKKEPVLTK